MPGINICSAVRSRPEDLQAWLESRPTGGGLEVAAMADSPLHEDPTVGPPIYNRPLMSIKVKSENQKNGTIVHVQKEENLKPSELPGKNRGNERGTNR